MWVAVTMLHNLWLAGVKKCPVCGAIGTFNAADGKAPPLWIYLQAFGVDQVVCSEDCVAQIRKRYEARQEQLKRNRFTLPPDVVI